MTTKETHERGAELRAAIKLTYERLSASGGLQGGFHGTDVTEVFLQNIPIGTPFQEAVAILKDAGFVIDSYPDLNAPPNPNRTKDWYALIARIAPFSNAAFSQVELFVSLLPPSPGEYTIVFDISATFFCSTI
jgi:hypothetical protein